MPMPCQNHRQNQKATKDLQSPSGGVSVLLAAQLTVKGGLVFALHAVSVSTAGCEYSHCLVGTGVARYGIGGSGCAV